MLTCGPFHKVLCCFELRHMQKENYDGVKAFMSVLQFSLRPSRFNACATGSVSNDIPYRYGCLISFSELRMP